MFARMFKSSSQYFSALACPRARDCRLPHCVFSHSSTAHKRPLTTVVVASKEEEHAEPQHKKNKCTGEDAASVVLNGTTATDILLAVPRGLPGVGAPATLQQRMRYVSILEKNYTDNGIAMPKRAAVDAEYAVAVTKTQATYNNAMKSVIWASKTAGVVVSASTTPQRGKPAPLSDSQTYDAVKKLIHTGERLVREGYVTEIPVLKEGEQFDPLTKKCDRCGDPFNITTIMKPTTCKFHERKKRFENNDKYWECCSEVVGESQGCKINQQHVFKAKTAFELHQLIPFRETPLPAAPTTPLQEKKRIIGLDCEMGYTSKGMEMIRLTTMDFYSGKVLFDEVAKPSGQILDLNTTWSGVSQIPEDAMTLDETMRVVLGNLIDRDTIIVGHGLENDLNTMRLVHHNVVDTAILYPKSLTKKFALKELAFQFLDRKIQSGEHSSEEDSLAAIDIIKARISNKK